MERIVWKRYKLLAIAMLVALGGCARAYHCYDGCGVNCHYCPPNPLPVVTYPECICHSGPAAKYIHGATDALP